MPGKDKGIRRKRPMRDEVLEGNDMLINGVPVVEWVAMSEEQRDEVLKQMRQERESNQDQ